MDRIVSYIKESMEELRNRVTWPSYINLSQTTGVVLVAILVLTLIVMGMDGIVSVGTDLLYISKKAGK